MNTQDPQQTEMLRQCWAELGISQDLIEQRGLTIFAEAATLVIAATDADGREHRLVPDAAGAWSAMQSAAEADSVDLYIVSAHRSIRRQIELVRRKLRSGQSLDTILAVIAPPGCSEHHTGCAIDIGTRDSRPLEKEFESTPAYQWLTENARRFDFILSFPEGNRWGYSYEPWHWCYSGTRRHG